MFQYVDVGIFQKACRLTISRLGDRDYRGDPDIKYFRIREGYELMRDMLAHEKAKQERK